jgi:hypothetical protein
MVLRWPATEGHAYTIVRSGAFGSGDSQILATGVTGAGSEAGYIEPAPLPGRALYRVLTG